MPVNDTNTNDQNPTLDVTAIMSTLNELKTLASGYQDVRKDVNAVMKAIKDLKVTPHQDSAVDPPADPVAPSKVTDAQANAEITELRRKTTMLEKAIADATARERSATEAKAKSDLENAWRGALDKVPFRDDVIKNGAFQMFIPNVEKQEDGSYLYKTPTGLFPLDAAVKNLFIEGEQSWMVQPKGQGGAGATNSSGVKTNAAGKQFNIETLTPEQIQKFSPEDRAEFHRQLADAAQTLNIR